MNQYEEKTIKTETLYQGHVVTLEKHTVELVNQKIAYREVIRHAGGVAILALVEDKMILVRQYRKAAEKHLYEIPAGKLDKKNEQLLDAAKRELEEETHYRAVQWKKLMQFYVTPGYCDEVIHLFLATDMQYVTDALPGDEDEFLDIEYKTLDQAKQMIETGEIMDAKTICAIQQWEILTRTSTMGAE